MRLEVVEAPDHSACMEQLRSRYGADCVVVHSFRVKDRYRVVVALETESCRNAAPLESAVKNVVLGSRIRWDTLMDGAPTASSCRIHIFRRVPRAAATCLISARVELPSLHPPPHGLPHAAAAARPGPATSTTPCSLLQSQEI